MTHSTSCKLCGKIRRPEQVFCGAACSARWEAGERPAGFQEMTADQVAEREDCVKAFGQRANALMRYDGKAPPLVASALLWCAVTMHVEMSQMLESQGLPGVTREHFLELVGATWDDFLDLLRQRAELVKKGEKT